MWVEIITPERRLLREQARQVKVPGAQSPFAMLEGHQAIISPLVPEGIVRVDRQEGGSIRVQISGHCIVEQHENEICILADRAKIIEPD